MRPTDPAGCGSPPRRRWCPRRSSGERRWLPHRFAIGQGEIDPPEWIDVPPDLLVQVGGFVVLDGQLGTEDVAGLFLHRMAGGGSPDTQLSLQFRVDVADRDGRHRVTSMSASLSVSALIADCSLVCLQSLFDLIADSYRFRGSSSGTWAISTTRARTAFWSLAMWRASASASAVGRQGSKAASSIPA